MKVGQFSCKGEVIDDTRKYWTLAKSEKNIVCISRRNIGEGESEIDERSQKSKNLEKIEILQYTKYFKTDKSSNQFQYFENSIQIC